MANEIGTSLLSGITNSTFNLGEMSKSLAEAEVAGKRSFIEQKQEKTTTELDAIKYLQTNLTAFQSYVSDLASPDLFSQKSVTSSNENVITASVGENVAPGSYQIEAVQLAQRHTLVSDQGYSSPNATVTGTNLQINGQQIDLDASNNTLEGVRNQINEGSYGVTASIVNNGGTYQMMFTSTQSGAEGEVTLGGDSSLTSAGVTETAAAQDAQIKLNGLTLSSSTNNFDDAVDGVNFQLKSAAPGTTQTITVDNNTSEVKENIQSFVQVFNQMGDILDDLSAYDRSDLTEDELESEEYEFYGDLAGSSLLRSVQSQLRASMSGAIEELDTNFNSLASIGITTDREGKLQLDEAQLDTMLNTNLDGLRSVFSKGGSTDDALIDDINGSDKTATGSYDLDITQVAERAIVNGGAADATIDLTGKDARFNVSVDGSTQAEVTMEAKSYTRQEFADAMSAAINNLDDVKQSGASVSVTVDASNQFVVASNRYGSGSSVDLTGFTADMSAAGSNTGFTTGLNDTGVNVDGTLSKDGVSINIGAYADLDDGRKINISDFASKDGEYVDMRGMSFTVMGGGPRTTTIDFAQGFASRLDETVNRLFEADTGLVSRRIDSLNTKMESYKEQSTDLDARYEKLLQKYQMQFSSLQSILSSTEQTRNMLTQRFGGEQ
jgi:flagellar hook-associated protein 2